ncbi:MULTISPECIES: ABC transporter ATP-binding protein [Streptomyces]|uniref:ABC transporter ATP-binding protein n=1 Tax=Streptomyces TaxID=1883 RepID=UPI00226D61DA|nr:MULTISPECIES: ABC transporter ATP-binding protein [unclassified Streptomyces]MCY0944121.1 ABC transporter ATP-binding protein [Streptomyces sp. H34-AA3]MCY0950426.1 ABC transporter ATP-binding protein [Streptomyces sp. H27-S2]MCZ4085106.1 ABC transporter ATP-binding protein [Streptomyces sp. H34-S5]
MSTQSPADRGRAGAPTDSVGRWLWSHVSQFKGHITAHLTGSVLWHLLSAGIPIAVGVAIDAVLQPEPDMARFTGVILLILTMVLLRGLGGFVSTYSLEAYASGTERDARTGLFSALLRKGQSFYNRRPVGDLSARVTGDAEALNLMLSPGADMTIDMLLSILVPVITIGLIAPELLLSPVTFVIVFVLVLLAHGRRLEPVAGQVREANGNLGAQVSETLSGIETVAAIGSAESARRSFNDLARDYRDATVRQADVQSLYLPPLLINLAVAGALLHGAVLVREGSLSIGEFIAYLGLMGALRGPTQLAAFSIGLLYYGIAGARRILEVINDRSDGDDSEGGHAAPVDGEVRFDSVTFGYGDSPVLHDISFTVPAGASVALVGPTGSGKTTLLQLLNRTYVPGSGRVLVDGVDVAAWDLESLRGQIAVIEQDVVLFSSSIADNLAFGSAPGTSRADLEQAARDARAHDFIMESPDGYETLVGERGVTLSGGQRQRIAIGRALLADPRILVLDDSTSAVDSATEQEIHQAVQRASAGRTTFMITPRLSRIRSADHIIVLDRGRIVGQGRHEDLIDGCELYHRIFAPYLATATSGADEGGH